MHDGQVKADNQGGELTDARPRSLNTFQFPRNGHLVWVGIAIPR